MSGSENKFHLLALLAACSLWLAACNTIDLYEQNVSIPRHEWKSSYTPSFKFTIRDTTVPYDIFIVLRHNEKYNYNNIWVQLSTQGPGDSLHKVQYELTLANLENGWLGTAMDDLYEHRIRLTPKEQYFYFKRPGEYTFTIGQVMREDPLENVLNVGLRIEKRIP